MPTSIPLPRAGTRWQDRRGFGVVVVGAVVQQTEAQQADAADRAGNGANQLQESDLPVLAAEPESIHQVADCIEATDSLLVAVLLWVSQYPPADVPQSQ